jgi:signal transduction histidine kinase
MEFNVDGDYIKINSENDDLLFVPKEELEGKNLKDIFEPQTAKFFIDAIKDCINNKKLVVIEYPLQIKNEEHWFTARLSYKEGNTAIFNAYNITEKKLQEKLLIDSEMKLKELNEMKNNFFSVIAHDIKGPLGSQKAILDLLMEQFNELDEVTLQSFIKNLQISSNNLYVLLEDLLKWSLSQSGKIEVLKETFNLNESVSSVLTPLLKDAQQKNIRIINELEENVKVLGDNNLTKTILRNLVTNAIKFTKSGGVIRIFTEKLFIEGKQYFNIFVSDTGIGIEPEILNSLFMLDKTQTRLGTANEKGNGLGLLLCKEFAEKQNSKIEVKSVPGEGSKFSFKLPAG